MGCCNDKTVASELEFDSPRPLYYQESIKSKNRAIAAVQSGTQQADD